MKDDEQLIETGRLAEVGLQASTLVHELRQPVFAIKSLVQLLVADADPVNQTQWKLLLDQVRVLEVLLTRYSTSSQQPTGTAEIVDPVGIIQDGVQALGGSVNGISIEVDTSRGGGPLQLDRVALQQITSNLVRNALDAARSRVLVEFVGATLRVTDDGPGIDASVVDRIYEPFVTTKPPGKGTGLGLAVTRSLVQAMGGRLSWQSGTDGTCFQVELSEGQDDGE